MIFSGKMRDLYDDMRLSSDIIPLANDPTITKMEKKNFKKYDTETSFTVTKRIFFFSQKIFPPIQAFYYKYTLAKSPLK